MIVELVSILIPCKNAQNWLKETIESALSQTYHNKEVIIVDDGSTDNSLMIAKQYESSNVKVIAQENKGGCAARNKALEFAQGDYIQWLDADDILAHDKIEKQINKARSIANQKILLSCAWGSFYYRYWEAKFVPDKLWCDLTPVEWLTAKFQDGFWMSNSAWLVSRLLTELAGPWDERLSKDQDGEYFSRVIAKSDKVVFVPEAREYIRRSNQRSVSKARSRSAMESDLLSRTLCIGYLLSLEDSEVTRNACKDLLQRSLAHYYPYHTDLMKKANELARGLGRELSSPILREKFAIAEMFFGFGLANLVRRLWIQSKHLIVMNWDKLLYNLSKKVGRHSI